MDLVITQARIVYALTLREIQLSNAHFKFGYIWALIEPAIYVSVITGVHVFVHGLIPTNMTPILFCVLGVLPEQTFRRTALAIDTIVHSHRMLLMLPRVTPLDIILGKAFQCLITYATVFWIFAICSAAWEHSGFPRNIGGLILVYFNSWLIGLGFGLVLVYINVVFPPIEKLMMPIIRLIFYTSGLYFTIRQVPTWAWPYLTWNPMLHTTELLRTYWWSTYNTPIGSPLYLTSFTTLMLLLGLALQRYVRKAQR